jgi:hypothetical protein
VTKMDVQEVGIRLGVPIGVRMCTVDTNVTRFASKEAERARNLVRLVPQVHIGAHGRRSGLKPRPVGSPGAHRGPREAL